jgi:spermidine synthase
VYLEQNWHFSEYIVPFCYKIAIFIASKHHQSYLHISMNRKLAFNQTLLLFIFFFSGFAALIYQVIWQRWLVFYTGISSLSISLIVSAFMAGLGLGYLVGGQIADKTRHQKTILFFILAEIGIGTFALFSKPLIYDWLYQANALQANSVAEIYTLHGININIFKSLKF